MASVLNPIVEQVITDVLTTAVTKCDVGYRKYSKQFFPVAHVAWDDGIIKGDINNTQDVTYKVYIWVEGSTFDEANDVLEELMSMWENNAKRTVLTGLGVINFQPISFYPPMVDERFMEGYSGSLTFEMEVRHIY